MKKSTKYIVVAVLFLCLCMSAVYVFSPVSLNNLIGNTTVSISQINVQPQDSAHILGNEYYGGFWNILVYVNANDQLAGVVLPEGQKGSVTYENAIKALETGAKVEIKIDPGQPYIIRNLVEKQDVLVAPAATGTSNSVSSVQPTFYDWAEPTFRIYTPYTVSVYKDNVLKGSITMGEGSAITQSNSISTGEGTVIIENLGILGGQYTNFGYSNPIMIMDGSGSYIYDRYAVNNYVGNVGTNTYANYWYGGSRNSAGVATNPIIYIGGVFGPSLPPSQYGGWDGNNVGSTVAAVQPGVFQTTASGCYSFTEFLTQAKNIPNLATTTFQSKDAGFTGALWQHLSLVTDSSNNRLALRLDIPWSAFGTPLVNIRVPTELCDTWVEQPPVANAEISAIWESSGTTNQDVYGANRIKCTVTNKADATATVHLAISSGNGKLAVTPLEMNVPNLVKNVPQTVYFDATNLGVTSEVSSIPVTITASDPYSGTQLDSFTLYGTLKPTLVNGTTVLHLTAYEKDSDVEVVGLPLVVQYAGLSVSKSTNENGELTMTLATSQGGAYVGSVVVSSPESDTYFAKSSTYTISSATTYNVTFEVERKDSPTDDIDWMLVVLVIAIFAVFAGIIVAVVKLRKPRYKAKVRRY